MSDQKIKNHCASCGKKFPNSPALYEENGNYCADCNSRISFQVEWRFIDKNNLTSSTLEKMAKIEKILWQRWGVRLGNQMVGEKIIN